MMRFLFGALLALLVLYPSFLSAITAVATEPAVLAFGAGVILWPRISRRIKGWTA